MPWTRLDDHVMQHPKLANVHGRAFELWIAGLVHCAAYLTNGIIVQQNVRKLRGYSIKNVQKLVENRLWRSHELGYEVHDFLTYNSSREDIEQARVAAKLRMQHVRAVRANTTSKIDDCSQEVRELFANPYRTVRTSVRTSTSVPEVLSTSVHVPTARVRANKGHHAHTYCGDNFCVSATQHELLSKQLGSARDSFDLLTAYPRWDALNEPIDNLLPWLKAHIAAEVDIPSPKAIRLAAMAKKASDW